MPYEGSLSRTPACHTPKAFENSRAIIPFMIDLFLNI